jgi:hypothetical protein
MSFNTSSHKMSGVRSPVLASAMSFSAIASLMPSLRNGVIGTALLPYQAGARPVSQPPKPGFSTAVGDFLI